MAKRAEGFKLVNEHHPECFCAEEPDTAFVLPAGVESRDKIGRFRPDGGGYTWHLFRCNDPRCHAQMAVRWDVLARFIGTEGGSDAH